LASIYRLSTAAAPPSERLAFWNSICAGAYRPMVVDAEPEGFQGVLTRLRAGELEITSAKSTPLVTRSAASDANICSDEKTFSLHLVHSGRCRIRHAGAEIVAETGDMIVADGGKSYELAFTKPVQGLVVSLPWARFGGHAEALEALAGRPIGASGPAAALSEFIRSMWDHLVEREGEEWPNSASDVVWDLLEALLQGEANLDVCSGGSAEALRRRAKALVDRQLSDPGFGAVSIAESLGVSTRYLQLVFAQVGTTPSRFLLVRRLEAAAARLRRPDKLARITDVAMECGFSDLSHFSRAFRRRFGVTARDYRLSFGARSADWA
jgi:AraC-like DNA-binding protein